MAKVLFISEDYVKRNSTVDENVDAKLIYSAIQDAQDIQIHELLGTDLYVKLKADVEDFIENATPIPADYDTLLEAYVKPALLKWTEFEMKYMNHYKIRNSGSMIRTSDNSTAANFTEVKYLMDKESYKAQFYSDILVNYLCGNTDLYPEYCSNDDAGDISALDTGFKSSIFLG